LYFNYLAFKNETILYYGLINLLVGLFNLLPVAGLDGGTVLYSIIARKSDPNRAMLTIKIITASIAVSVFILAVTLTLRGEVNLSLYIIAVYLFLGVLLKM
ncbi:MAG: site-2 protease family protein, partial [Acutalibacteraceae bacterium]